MGVRGGWVFSRPFGTWFVLVFFPQHFVLGCVRSSPRDSCLDSRWGCVAGGCSAVPPGLDWFMWVSSQHFVLGYVRSSLRDLIYATTSNVFFSKVGSISRAAFDS